MSGADEFDIGLIRRSPGVTLLEAGAGSGKTYAIEGLYLRIAAGWGVPMKRILVCTFTNAATHELRARIRTRLRTALEELDSGVPSDAALVASLEDCGGDLGTLRRRIVTAIVDFDMAQVFTIHGFCGRVLAEHSFECGCDFGREPDAESHVYATRAALDYLRRAAAAAPLSVLCLRLAAGANAGWSPDGRASAGTALERRLGRMLSTRGPDREIPLRPEIAEAKNPELLEPEFSGMLDRLRDAWKSDRDEVMDFLRDRKRTKSRLYNAADDTENALDAFASGALPLSGTLKALALLTGASVAAETKAKAEAPDLPFFGLCEDFSALLERGSDALARDFLGRADDIVSELRACDGTIGFDDLLYRTALATRDTGPGSLTNVLRARYEVALVDEFQDTDRLQWRIFGRIFGKGDGHALYIIGDPKQSIYRFRGADVHAYLDAAENADFRYTLGRNWRSDPLLVKAVNALFSASGGDPFLQPGIVFQPAIPAAREDEPDCKFVAGPSVAGAPLRFVLPDPETSFNSGTATDWLLSGLCRDVSALLNSGSAIGGRPVNGGDVAVLVRNKKTADQVRERLRALGVTAVVETDASVFDSGGAAAVRDFLAAVLDSEDARLLRWALAGPFFGLTAAELAQLRGDDDAWRARAATFVDFRKKWEQRGLMPAFSALCRSTGLRARLMSQTDGERLLTDVLHLAELLNSAERADSLSPESLLRWLGTMIDDTASRPADGHQIRLECETSAVRVMTAHRSKGLQFPAVFVMGPGFSTGGHADDPVVLREDSGPVFWPRPDSEASREADGESLRDEIRLMYVALTRACHLCTLYVPPEYSRGTPVSDTALGAILNVSDMSALLSALETCRESSPDSVAVEVGGEPGVENHAAAEDAVPEIECRRFSGNPEQKPMISSFSALHGAGGTEAELPERDEAAAVPPVTVETEKVAEEEEFPHGASVGTFFHACLERMDYAEPSGWAEIIQDELPGAGLDSAKWMLPAMKILENVLRTPMGEGGALLSNIQASERLCEAEFYFPAHRLDRNGMADAFAGDEGPLGRYAENLRRLSGRDMDGYMKGYIDLVFRHEGRLCILDWKSNRLGPSFSSYSDAALDGAMRASDYYLQGCIYALALRRAMSARAGKWSYESGFGDIYYVFLRGVDPERPGSGIVRFRPSPELLDGLEAALACGEAQP